MRNTTRKQVAVLLVVVSLAAAGCASLERNAYRTIGSAIVTVDLAMQSWGEYVRTKSAAGTPVPAEQETRVREAYLQYQESMRVARGVVSTYQVATDAGIRADRDALIEAIESVEIAADSLSKLIAKIKGS
jgi:hypothetical protein